MSDKQIKESCRMYKCPSCKKKFLSRALLADHSAICKEALFPCTLDGCKKRFKLNYLKIHQCLYHNNTPNNPPASPKVYYPQFVNTFKSLHHKSLRNALINHQHLAYNICLTVSAQKISTREFKCLSSNYITVKDFVDIEDTIDILIQLLTLRAQQFHKRLNQIQVEKVEVNTKRFHPHTGTFIPLPNDLATIKNIEVHITTIFSRKTTYMCLPRDVSNDVVLINTRNYDQYSFKWAILCAVANLYVSLEQADINISSTYFIDNIADNKIHCAGVDLDFTGLAFPCEVWHCLEFEKRNRLISVNIFGLERSESSAKYRVVGPLYRTRCEQDLHINLLFLEDVNLNKTHFVYIKSLARLLPKDNLNGEGCDALASFCVCNTCLRQFVGDYMLDKHKSDKKNCEHPISFD